ncbi:unnamed protein product [Owenia fusiformis]|uniref:Uncharacterized protein n=1 Tax=Owenia fusiformis TaxID=6347 RepID=A0A8J1YB16_OWEFU|nr:unnamed protein product [Owenia fusiformis]
MKLAVTFAVLALLIGVPGSDAVGFGSIRDYYGQIAEEAWLDLIFEPKKTRTNPGEIKRFLKSKQPGRGFDALSSGVDFDKVAASFDKKCLDITDYKEQRPECEEREGPVDLCFIVQISCRCTCGETLILLDGITSDINKIIGSVGNDSSYMVVTYSKDAKQIINWSSTASSLPRDLIVGGETCDDCKARTQEALSKCKELLKVNNENNNREWVPDVIVTFTDGLSWSDKYDVGYKYRQDTIQAILNIRRDCNYTAVRPFKIPDCEQNYVESDEWPLLEYTPSSMADFVKVEVKNLHTNPYETNIPVIQAELDESCRICCNADIVLVIDRSNSITPENINIVLEFYSDFIAAQEHILDPHDPATLSTDPGLRFAIISYNRRIFIHANLGFHNQTQLIDIIAAIPRTTDKYTHTDEALIEAKRQFNQFGRPDLLVRKIALVGTDGRTWKYPSRSVYTGPATIDAANAIKDDGGEIYMLGLPNKSNRTDGYEREWIYLASEPINCTILDFNKGGGQYLKEHLEYAALHFTTQFCTQGPGAVCLLPEN